MVQIVLIRPGSTDFDDDGRIQGNLDIPVNEAGTQQVRQTIEEVKQLGISVVYCGPCQAVLQSATAVAEALDVKLKRLDTLQNINQGLWQGMLIDEVKRKHPKVYRQWQEQPEIICPPGGEMLGAAQERMQVSLAKILKKHKNGVIALVVADPLASLVHAYLTQSQIRDLWKTGDECVKWEAITFHPERLAQTNV